MVFLFAFLFVFPLASLMASSKAPLSVDLLELALEEGLVGSR